MESACGECDNEEDVVQTSPSSDFLTTNSQALGGVSLSKSQPTNTSESQTQLPEEVGAKISLQ